MNIRLKRLFGHTLKVKSEFDKGIKVTFSLPYGGIQMLVNKTLD